MRRPPAPAIRRVAAGGRERGSSSIQMVLLLPALFLVMFAGMQAALWYHARAVAISAAQEGARRTGAEQGTAAAGRGAASSFIADAGGDDVLADAHVSIQRGPTTATATVSGHSLSVIPGWNITVRQSASVPTERITG
ncbi:TadE/TadG family type IV pilus assembly protein [Segeticoccus rhizosphaerae]|uniref:TadE/TadG family type IV pilus assembly protein n=1 Tax=Segeticoccus rhizosphaerae TaxID=1104777 RepID=UPI0010BFDD34|nr:TadE/TadG family type IV pilus assembly protein [Ornithinicoccus soli]